PPSSFEVGPMPYSVMAADLNGDGHLDLVATDFNAGTGSTVSVLSGIGNGTFAEQTAFPVGLGPWAATSADFNADGHPDLVTAKYGEGTVSVLLGTGAGSFGPQTAFPAGSTPVSLAVGDFNGDGALDLAVANGTDAVHVLLGTGTGSFGPPTSFAAG